MILLKIMRLKNKIALITGASSGIGAAVAKAYAKEGAHVILLARNKKALEKVSDDIHAAGGKATLIPFDLNRLSLIDGLTLSLAERFKKLDIFIGNAGLLGQTGPLIYIPSNIWDEVMNVNATANMRFIRNLHPLLMRSSAGRVIFTSSSIVDDPAPYFSLYKTSKIALNTIALSYSQEIQSTSIKVNIIYPGKVRSKLRANAFPGENPDLLPAPETIIEHYLHLGSEACTSHGKIIDVGV